MRHGRLKTHAMTGHTLAKSYVLLALPALIFGITTVHHDKPEESQILKMVAKMKQETDEELPLNATSERQKRLLPYINYYLTGNSNYQRPPEQYHLNKENQYVEYSPELADQSQKFTPFLDSNALPGPFKPMIKNPEKPVDYSAVEKSPNFGAIYDKLSHLKLLQQPYVQRQPQTNYVSLGAQYKITQPSKTTIETYTPTNIDVPVEADHNGYYDPGAQNYRLYKIYRQKQPQPIAGPVYQQFLQPVVTNPPKTYLRDKLRQPIVYYQQDPSIDDLGNQVRVHRPFVFRAKPQVSAIVDDNYVAQKFTAASPGKQYQYVQYSPPPLEPEPIYYHHQVAPQPTTPPPESTNTLGQILKQLQESNALPHTLTPENIDNSIKTLVKILNNLKNHEQFLKPTAAPPDAPHVEEIADIDAGGVIDHGEELPGTTTQNFPADTEEGGTPGRPGVDYPALSTIPKTSFNCKTQRYKGFFGDPHTNCQVWHYCDLNGGQASFLCPNGTIFSQVALTCDWWYNVKCSSTAQLYVLNERLYKYILPLSPKFPEDYSGPLVDKYLALKFKEMEEKMMKKRKHESDDKDQSDSDEEEASEEKSSNVT